MPRTNDQPYHSFNKKGQEEAEKIIPYLVDKNIDIIYSSDLLRAKQTAEIVNKKLNKPIIFDRALRELHSGEMQGNTSQINDRLFPNRKKYLTHKHNERPAPNAETINEAKIRIMNF